MGLLGRDYIRPGFAGRRRPGFGARIRFMLWLVVNGWRRRFR